MNNTFTNQAQIGQNKWWQYAVTLAILFVGITSSLIFIKNFVLPALQETNQYNSSNFDLIIQYVGTACVGLIGIAIIYFTIKHIHKRSFSSLNYSKSFSLIELFEGILVCALLIVVGQMIFDFSSFANFDFSVTNSSLLKLVPLVAVCVGVQSYFEELLFRGYLLQGFALKIKNKWLLFCIIGLLFSLIHIGASIQNLLEVFFVGFLLSFIVFKRGNLFFVTGIHLVFNFYNLYLLSVFNQEELGGAENMVMEWNGFFSTLLLLILLVSYVLLKERLFTTKNKPH